MSHDRRNSSTRSPLVFAIQIGTTGLAMLLQLASPAEARKFTLIPIVNPPANRMLSQFYPGFPAGDRVTLAGAPFELPNASSPVFASTTVTPTIELTFAVKQPVAVHLLLNASNGWEPAGRQIGHVRLAFDDGHVLDRQLVLGQNVRDWQTSTSQVPRVDTTTDRSVIEVYRASRANTQSQAVLDELTIVMDDADRQRVLTSIAIVDELPGSLEPGLVLVGASVQSSLESITYVRTENLFVSDADGTQETEVSHGCTGCDRPALSPDGQMIVYAQLAGDGTWEIRGLNVHTSSSRLLANAGPATPGPKPALSADGRRVVFHKAFVRGFAPGVSRVQLDIVSVDVTSGWETRITKTNGANELFPAPAPDGSVIVYSTKGQLYQIGSNGKKRKRIARTSAAMVDPQESVVDATGQRVVFSARTCRAAYCPSEVFSLDRPSGIVQQLTTTMGDANSPAALTDGKTVLLGARGAIWAVGYEGGAEQQIVADARNPSGSPTDLPSGCFPSEAAFTCYQPFRTVWPTVLRMGPSASSAPVTGDPNTATVPANAVFGVASLTDSMCIEPPAQATMRPSVGSPAYRWGYVRGAGALGGLNGWVAEADLAPTPDVTVTDLSGPKARDYQCGQPRLAWPANSKCRLADASAQLSIEPFPFLECNVHGDQPLYASPGPDAWASDEVGMPVWWLSNNDLVEPDQFVAQISPWRCVKVGDAKNVPQPPGEAVYGWIRTDDPGWCQQPGCGDGRVGGAETCDGDGGCRSDCTKCGDNVAQSQWGETCDGDVGCRSDCTKCGDNVTQSQWGETCDGDAGCRSDCTKCGDNVTQSQWGEQCDGNLCEWGACQQTSCTCPLPKACVIECANHSGGSFPVHDRTECMNLNPCGFGAQIADYYNGYPRFYPPEGGCGIRTRRYYDGVPPDPEQIGPLPTYVCGRCSLRNGHYRASGDNPFGFLENCQQGSISRGVALCQAHPGTGGLISVFVGDCSPWP